VSPLGRLVTIAAAGAAVVAIAPASAATTYSTHLTLSKKAPAFHGKIFSPGGSLCKNHRTIGMYRARPGKDKLLGSTTSHHGKWFVDHPNFPSGEYYAKAKQGGSAALGIKCRATKSRVVVVD
jgi:hypothetical protein